MVGMAKGRRKIDPQDDWRRYVEAVNGQQYYARIYPGLVYNEKTWQIDLHAHILVRRRRRFDGSEDKERKEAKVGPRNRYAQNSADNLPESFEGDQD